MRIGTKVKLGGFTLAEMLVAIAAYGLIMAAIFASIMALNRAYSATDDYFSTHIQQIRIIDYLARDVKRSYSVTATNSGQTVTCIMPNYIIKAGDPEAVTDSTTIGQRRTPVVFGPPYSAVVNYGSRNTRTMVDAVTTNGSPTVTSATGAFTSTDVGNPVSCTTIPAGATVTAVNSTTSITVSSNATGTGSAKTLILYGDGDRTVIDAVTTSGSTTLTSSTAYFTSVDVGKAIVGTSLNALTTISSVTNSTTAVLSSAANATATGMYATIGGTVVQYNVSGSTITRTENGVITTVASSTDQLMPTTTDWQLSNTEYTTSNVTFLPEYLRNMSTSEIALQKSGTTVYATSYLRNKRRGN